MYKLLHDVGSMKCVGDSVWCTTGEVSGVQCILCPLCVDLNLHSSLSSRSQLALTTDLNLHSSLSARSQLALTTGHVAHTHGFHYGSLVPLQQSRPRSLQMLVVRPDVLRLTITLRATSTSPSALARISNTPPRARRAQLWPPCPAIELLRCASPSPSPW